MNFKFCHNNINVLNLEKSLEFYKKALGLTEVRRKESETFTLVFLCDKKSEHNLELTYLRDWDRPYNLGDNEIHLAFRTDDFDKAYKLHQEMGCICFENKSMGLYFISDPDGYWIEILPPKNKVLKHIVFWKFEDNAEGADRKENINKAREMLLSLTDVIPEIKSMEIGIDISDGNGDYDLALYTTFDSREALDTYQNHPEHLKVAAFIGKARKSRACCDFFE